MELVHDQNDIKHLFKNFEKKVRQHCALGCLFIFHESLLCLDDKFSCADTLAFLAEKMTYLGEREVTAKTLLNGGVLRFPLQVACPVTNQSVIFYDFDAVAFCP